MKQHSDGGSSDTMSSDATFPETSEAVGGAAGPPPRLMLVLVWSAYEPSRSGEVVIPPHGNPGDFAILGRGEATEADRPYPRLIPSRHRPGHVIPTESIKSPKVSRVQLRLRAVGDEAIAVENRGQCKLHHNGVEHGEFRLVCGDTLEVGKQLVFLCVRRPAWIAKWASGIVLDDSFPFGGADAHGIVGESPSAWELRRQIAFYGPLPGHILVRGESGTGKELVARALHATSSRARRPLVSRSAATLPEGILEAELFGNLRNYPNPGMVDRPGIIGEANGSTLFLDEIGEIDPGLQARLLRVLDSGEYHRLGEATSRRSDFRLVAATNRPEKALKHDLLPRLVFRIETPSLNDRREDILPIATHMLGRIAKSSPTLAAQFFSNGRPRMSTALIRMLVQHSFKTNVRELETLLWQALADSRGDTIEPPVRPPEPPARPPEPPVRPPGGAAPAMVADDADAYPSAPADAVTWTPTPSASPAALQACLDAHNGVITDAAKAWGISRDAYTRLIKKYGLVVRKRPR